MILNATGTGLFFKTMLYLANQTADENTNTIQDFYNTAMGAEIGKFPIIIEFICSFKK